MLKFTHSNSTDDTLRAAFASYFDEYERAGELLTAKATLARRFDIRGMDRIVAICHWGRSGSLLLTSFLDHHDDIVMLPFHQGERIYAFCESYAFLSVWEKLVSYPTYAGIAMETTADFFLKDNPWGNFAIEPADYYAAVRAIFEVFSSFDDEWLEGRAQFIRLLHIAYDIALDRGDTTSSPMIVYAQHWVTDGLAQRLVDDFPHAKFLHTVRDPITGVDSWFKHHVDMYLWSARERRPTVPKYLDAAVATMLSLLSWDHGHTGMKDRTAAIRFEDMHLDTEGVMRKVAEWLDVPFKKCLLESTWNGNPYIVEIRGVPTCGANPINAKRRATHLSTMDCITIFCLYYDDFVRWKYDLPRFARFRIIRLMVLLLALIKPMRIELLNLHESLKLGRAERKGLGRIMGDFGIFLVAAKRRARMVCLFAKEGFCRLLGMREPMRIL